MVLDEYMPLDPAQVATWREDDYQRRLDALWPPCEPETVAQRWARGQADEPATLFSEGVPL